MSNLRLIRHATFADVVSAQSLASRAYGRTVDTFEAVDQLEDISGAGDRVLELTRRGRLPAEKAETLLQELMACFAEPLQHKEQLHQINRILRRFDE